MRTIAILEKLYYLEGPSGRLEPEVYQTRQLAVAGLQKFDKEIRKKARILETPWRELPQVINEAKLDAFLKSIEEPANVAPKAA